MTCLLLYQDQLHGKIRKNDPMALLITMISELILVGDSDNATRNNKSYGGPQESRTCLQKVWKAATGKDKLEN
jgi:hypothetical protein